MNTTSDTTLRLLEEVGAVRRGGHYVYKAGDHGPVYVDKDAVSCSPQHLRTVAYQMAVFFSDADVEVVVGPAMGGVALAAFVAYLLSTLHGSNVLAVYAEKDGNGFAFKRGSFPDRVRGRRVLVVEDVLTTGTTALAVIRAVQEAGGTAVAFGAICDRGNALHRLTDVPNCHALLTLPLEKFPAEDCPLCRDGVPVNTDLGHGAEFLARASNRPASA